jgi:hypothetical protein
MGRKEAFQFTNQPWSPRAPNGLEITLCRFEGGARHVPLP